MSKSGEDEKMHDSINFLENNDITYIENILLDNKNQLKIVPYEKLKEISQNDISVFCCKHGLYNIPTQELIDFLKEQIGGKEKLTIEIGSGNGVMAKALGITATDSYQQEQPKYKALYKLTGQTPVTYGENVKKFDAEEATKLFNPQICIGSWITHKYNPLEHWREGNEVGVDENKLIRKVKKYIFIGNEHTHAKKPILDVPHKTIKAEWLVSRGVDKSKNVIWIWER